MTSSVVAEGLTVVRGRTTVLHDLSFALRPGQVTGLLGPSGCGKTTLMRAIVGVQSRCRGRLECSARPRAAPARARVGYVTQAPSVYADLSRPGEPALLRRGPRRSADDRVDGSCARWT